MAPFKIYIEFTTVDHNSTGVVGLILLKVEVFKTRTLCFVNSCIANAGGKISTLDTKKIRYSIGDSVNEQKAISNKKANSKGRRTRPKSRWF